MRVFWTWTEKTYALQRMGKVLLNDERQEVAKADSIPNGSRSIAALSYLIKLRYIAMADNSKSLLHPN